MIILFVLIDVSLLTKVSQTVQRALSHEGFCEFQSRWAMIVTWHNVSRCSYSSSVFGHILKCCNYSLQPADYDSHCTALFFRNAYRPRTM